jgi:4'-phosphopantetheinyl transferase
MEGPDEDPVAVIASSDAGPGAAGPQLGTCDVHLWLLREAELPDDSIEACAAVLNDSERERAARFVFERDRRTFIRARWMLRTTLARYLGIEPGAVPLTFGQFGKPGSDHPAATRLALSFNLSHAGGAVAVCLARERLLGVDVEAPASREGIDGLADRYFTSAEAGELAQLSGTERRDRFFEYWTLKEACLKAIGVGLTLPLDRVCCEMPGDQTVVLRVDDEAAPHPLAWCAWQLRWGASDLLAVCAGRSCTEPLRLSVFAAAVGPACGVQLVRATDSDAALHIHPPRHA